MLGVAFPGIPTGSAEIRPNEPLEILLRPRGCWSSSCTRAYRLECDAGPLEGTALAVDSKLCLAENRQEGVSCTADCSSHLEARCYSFGLPEGSFTIRAGDLELTLEVPSTIPMNGLCVGEPF